METVSLQNLIKDVGYQLTEVYEGVTTGNGSTLFNFVDAVVSSSASYTNGEFAGSQVFFEEPAYTAGGNINPGPHIITDYTAATGTFVSNTAFRSAGVVPAGLNWVLLRPRGQGKTYQQYRAAIRYALDRMGVMTRGVNATLTTAANDWDYTIPAGLGWVQEIALSKSGYYPVTLTGAQWEMRPGRGLWLRYDVDVSQAATINLYGYTEDVLPSTLDGTVTCERADVVDLAVEYLQGNSPSGSENAKGGNKQQERLRFRRHAMPANLRRVLP